MIRRPRAAVSSSVQSGRMFGSKISGSGAVTYVPSVAEGVLNSAERGGYRRGPGTVATPLDQKSLRRHPTSGRPAGPDPLGDRGALERQVADLVGTVVVTQVNQIAAERISSRPRRHWLLKSSRLRSAACNWVPMAPSPTTTRSDNVSSRSVS